MATRKIIMLGDETLRKVCKPVSSFDKNLELLVDDLKETLTQANGLGLAAPQVGVLKRVCIIVNASGKMVELVNPEIIEYGDKIIIDTEGCLSIKLDGKCDYRKVPRAKNCTVKYFNKKGKEFTKKYVGYVARCVQHEVDHLNGILFIDRAVEE